MREQEDADRSVPVSRLAARSRVARSGSAALGRATVSAADGAATLSTSRSTSTDVAQLAAPVSAEQAVLRLVHPCLTRFALQDTLGAIVEVAA